MSQAVFCTVAVTRHDEGFYGPWNPPDSDGPAFDADDIRAFIGEPVCRAEGGRVSELRSPGGDTTRERVREALSACASVLQPGDLFVWYFAGHGAQVPNTLDGGVSRVLCLTDGFIHGRELDLAWTQFKPGVRIVPVVDACHSGTVANKILWHLGSEATSSVRGSPLGANTRVPEASWIRVLPDDIAGRAYKAHASNIDRWAADASAARRKYAMPMPQTVIALTACSNDELSWAPGGRGLFTRALIERWRGAAPGTSYTALHEAVVEGVASFRPPTEQVPELHGYGAANEQVCGGTRAFSTR